jgi:hypothetical protein
MFDEDAECDRVEGGRVSRMRLEMVVDEDGEEERAKTERRRLCLCRGRRQALEVGRDLRHMRGGQ